MPRRCVFGCQPQDIITHKLPHPNRFPNQFKAWCKIITGNADFILDHNLIVCDRHFTDSDRNRNHRLNALAVPSLFLPEVSRVSLWTEAMTSKDSEQGFANYAVDMSTEAPHRSTSFQHLSSSHTDDLQSIEDVSSNVTIPYDECNALDDIQHQPSSVGSDMTKGKHSSSKSGKVLNFDHLVFWVGNAKTASSYFVTRFGFKPLATRQPTEKNPVLSVAVRLNKVTIIFESPTSPNGEIAKNLTAHGDFVKDVAFEVQNLDELVRRAKDGGANIVKDITEEKDDNGLVRYAVLRTYGDNTHTLIDRSKYTGVLLPGYEHEEDDVLNKMLPETYLMYIDHVEGNMADGTLEDSVAWYEKNLNMHRFWCVDYKHDLVPYSCINSNSVINNDETVLLSLNEAAKGLRPTSKASEFVRALGASGVEHVALYTDDIVSTMRNLKARGADILTWPETYYDLIRDKLKNSSLKVAEGIDQLQENNILIDFDERGYMLQAFTKHVQARPTLFLEILQRRNHRGFGAMNYKWVFEAIELLEAGKAGAKVVKDAENMQEKNDAKKTDAA